MKYSQGNKASKHSTKPLLRFVFPLLLFGLALTLSRCNPQRAVSFNPTEKAYTTLSEYHFFKGALAEEVPNDRVLKYELISPLFSDYAWKHRYVYIPTDSQVTLQDSNRFRYPVGTALIKTFYYPEDFQKPEGKRRIMETRLLVKRPTGWEALPYVWNEAQTDATLQVAGERTEISWTDFQGERQELEYVVPNKNQCKSCHSRYEVLTYIGPTPRNLDREIQVDGQSPNQLDHWMKNGFFPETEFHYGARMVNYEDESEPLAQRARAYLEINCAHCHNPGGRGGTSGLDQRLSQQNPTSIGICKEPVAAGKGAGDFMFDIHPGQPDSSITVYRLSSEDPGIMMPELGRKMVHTEGVQIIREWIASLPGDCTP